MIGIVRKSKQAAMVARVVAAIVMAAATVSCYEDPGPAPRGADTSKVAEGFAIYRGSGYQFSYPQGWEIAPSNGGYNSFADVEILGPERPRALRAEINVTVPNGVAPDLDTPETVFSASAALLPNREVLRKEPAKVEGAAEALLIEDEYDQPVRGAVPLAPSKSAIKGVDLVRVHRLEIIARDSQGRVFALQLSAPERDFDVDAFDEVLRSFSLGGPLRPASA